jgi:hypothetical protein
MAGEMIDAGEHDAPRQVGGGSIAAASDEAADAADADRDSDGDCEAVAGAHVDV